MKPELVGKEVKKELTELQKLKIENLNLKKQLISFDSQITELRAQLNIVNLRATHATLEKELRAQLNASQDSVFNWDTLEFEMKEVK